jgi:hypothetical protein
VSPEVPVASSPSIGMPLPYKLPPDSPAEDDIPWCQLDGRENAAVKCLVERSTKQAARRVA